jgi:hypothetical protein
MARHFIVEAKSVGGIADFDDSHFKRKPTQRRRN